MKPGVIEVSRSYSARFSIESTLVRPQKRNITWCVCPRIRNSKECGSSCPHSYVPVGFSFFVLAWCCGGDALGVVSRKVVLNNVRLKVQQYLAPPAIDYMDADLEPEPAPLEYAPVASPGRGKRGPGARGRSGGRSAPSGVGGSDRRWNEKPQPPAPPQDFRQVQSFAAPGPARITKLPPKRKLGESPRAMQKASHRAYFKDPGARTGPGRVAVPGRIPISVAAGPGSGAGHPALPRATPGLKPGGGGGNDPYAIIDEQEKEILNCQETIAILQIKVKKLEQLVQLKDRKIDELSQMHMQAYDNRLRQPPPRVANGRR